MSMHECGACVMDVCVETHHLSSDWLMAAPRLSGYVMESPGSPVFVL